MATKSLGLDKATKILMHESFPKHAETIIENMSTGFNRVAESVFVKDPHTALAFTEMLKNYNQNVAVKLSELFSDNRQPFAVTEAKSIIAKFASPEAKSLLDDFAREKVLVQYRLLETMFDAAILDLDGRASRFEKVVELAQASEIAIALEGFKDADEDALYVAAQLIFAAVGTENDQVVGKTCKILDELSDVPSALKHIADPLEFIGAIASDLASGRLLRTGE